MRVLNASVFVLLAPCALIFGALLQIVIARVFSSRTKGAFALAASATACFSVFSLLGKIQDGRAIHLELAPWDGPLAITFHVDALSTLFAVMGTLLGSLVLLYSVGYMAQDRAASRFYCTMLIFIGGFIALVYSANLLFIYLCWEVIGLCSFTLVGFWYTRASAVEGARKVLLMTHIAGYGLLAAILILYQRTGSTLWTDPRLSHAFTIGVFLLMLVSLMAKSVQVPLHTWIPDAMAAPTPVSSLLHAACYVTAGVYLAARMHNLGAWPQGWSTILVGIGTVTMAVGVMYAMVQNDLKRMLAFSTVSQIGYMMLGIGIGTPLAITAALLHCLNHGFFKGGLFLNAGAVQHATGTRDMNELGGLAERMPRTTLCWFIGVGNMAGIPLMSGFVSKWMLYAAALQAGWVFPALIAWMVSLGTVFLCAKATSAVFLGPTTDKTEHAHEASPTMTWGMAVMAAGSILLGIAPQLPVNYLLNPVLSALNIGSGLQVTWFGFFSGAGTFSTAGGLLLALVSLAAGSAFYGLTYAAHASRSPSLVAVGGGHGVFTGGEPLSDMSRLTAHDFSQIFEQNWRSFFRSTNVDAAYRTIWLALCKSSRKLASAFSWLEARPSICAIGFSGVLILFSRILGPFEAALTEPRFSLPPSEILVACSISAIALAIAAFVRRATQWLVPWIIVIAGAEVAGLICGDPWVRLALLETGALLSAVPVWRAARTLAAKRVYLTVIALSAGSLPLAEFLIHQGASAWARALIISTVCLKLAAVPMFIWILKLADEIPAVLLGLIVAVIDIAAFAEFTMLAQASPILFAPAALLLSIAAVTSLLAGLLMISQNSLKRLLVLSTVEDGGFLLLGLSTCNVLGQSGMISAAVTHSVAKALLFACISGPEVDGALSPGHPPLASRYPVSTFGFLIGMLAMLGVPSTSGFAGRWRLYATALDVHPMLFAAFILSSAFALMGYLRALTTIWWGPEPTDRPHPIKVERRVLVPFVHEPLLLKSAIVVLAAALVIGGFWPAVFQALAGGHP